MPNQQPATSNQRAEGAFFPPLYLYPMLLLHPRWIDQNPALLRLFTPIILIPIFLLHPVRLGQNPVLLLLQFSITASFVICDEGSAFIKGVVVRRWQFGQIHVLPIRFHIRSNVFPRIQLLQPLRLYVGIMALRIPRLFHVARLLGCILCETFKESLSVLFAATWFHREVGWELRRTLEGGRAGNGVADSVPRHGCCFRGDDVVCSSFASQQKYTMGPVSGGQVSLILFQRKISPYQSHSVLQLQKTRKNE